MQGQVKIRAQVFQEILLQGKNKEKVSFCLRMCYPKIGHFALFVLFRYFFFGCLRKIDSLTHVQYTIPNENDKKQYEHKTAIQTSITRLLWTDKGRSV